jgi:Holliday junction resolvase RusA-like endonuclease
VTEPVPPFVLTVRGTPRPKTRPRFVNGRVISTANPHEKLWKKAIERSAFAAAVGRGDPMPLFTGPVRVDMVFTFEPSGSARDRLGSPHTIKPDEDNCRKRTLDALVRARVIADDSLVADGRTTKIWGERAGVALVVEQIDAAARSAPTSAAEGAVPGWLAGREDPPSPVAAARVSRRKR